MSIKKIIVKSNREDKKRSQWEKKAMPSYTMYQYLDTEQRTKSHKLTVALSV